MAREYLSPGKKYRLGSTTRFTFGEVEEQAGIKFRMLSLDGHEIGYLEENGCGTAHFTADGSYIGIFGFCNPGSSDFSWTETLNDHGTEIGFGSLKLIQEQ